MTKLAVRQVSESHNGLREMPRAGGGGEGYGDGGGGRVNGWMDA